MSAGADMALQLQVADSSLFAGCALFAGQAYHCAVQRFPGEPLLRANRRVPYCDGCPDGTTVDYDHCKTRPDATSDVTPLVAYARARAAAGAIDGLEHLASRRAFVYRGTEDELYAAGTLNATISFLKAVGVPAAHINYERSVVSKHAMPGITAGLCTQQGFASCDYDGAGAALKWLYGEAGVAHGRADAPNETADLLRPFDQQRYTTDPTGRDTLLARAGRIFVPPQCARASSADAEESTSAADACALHVFLHPCELWYRGGYLAITEHGGFNEWALRNSIVVLYPRLSRRGTASLQQKIACWDAYGQTGADYDVQAGAQMWAVRAMVEVLLREGSG